MERQAAMAEAVRAIFPAIVAGTVQRDGQPWVVSASARERYQAGLLPMEEMEAVVRAYLFAPFDLLLPRLRRLKARDIRHGEGCAGVTREDLLVAGAESPYEGRGLSEEAFLALRMAEGLSEEDHAEGGLTAQMAVVFRDHAGRSYVACGTTVAPRLHLVRCGACGKERAREAIRVVIGIVEGVVFTREYLAAVQAPGGERDELV
jgi:hypothetical protein